MQNEIVISLSHIKLVAIRGHRMLRWNHLPIQNSEMADNLNDTKHNQTKNVFIILLVTNRCLKISLMCDLCFCSVFGPFLPFPASRVEIEVNH